MVVTNANDGRPALKMINKRNVNIETERVPSKRETDVYASAMYAVYLYDPTKVVKVTFTGVTGAAATNGAPADVTDNGDKVDNVPEDKRVGRQKKASTAGGLGK